MRAFLTDGAYRRDTGHVFRHMSRLSRPMVGHVPQLSRYVPVAKGREKRPIGPTSAGPKAPPFPHLDCDFHFVAVRVERSPPVPNPSAKSFGPAPPPLATGGGRSKKWARGGWDRRGVLNSRIDENNGRGSRGSTSADFLAVITRAEGAPK